MQRIFFDTLPNHFKTETTFETVVPIDAVDEESFMQRTFNQWGFDDATNWNAYFDDLFDFSWLDGIKSVVMSHNGVPTFMYWERYLDVLIHALYRHENHALMNIPDYGQPKLFAKFNTKDWEYYLSHIDKRSLKRLEYLLADEATRMFDKDLF